MKTISITQSEVQELLADEKHTYPLYATQLLNLANQNAQGTRPRFVGQMSELIQQFDGKTLQEWVEWYLAGHPDAIEIATDRVFSMVEGLRSALPLIDKDMVRQWVEELVIVKTFAGLRFQEAILKKVAQDYGKEYRLATVEEESRGIDGMIGTQAVSIKPHTYQVMQGLNETIEATIISYEKKKGKIVISFEDLFPSETN